MSATWSPPVVRRPWAWALAGAACVGLQWVHPALATGGIRALGPALVVASGALTRLPGGAWVLQAAIALLTLGSAVGGVGPLAAWPGVLACLAWLVLVEARTRRGHPPEAWAIALRGAGSVAAAGLLVGVVLGEPLVGAWYCELGRGQLPWEVPWGPGLPAAIAPVAISLPLALASWRAARVAAVRRFRWLELAASTAALCLAGGWLGWLVLGLVIVASADRPRRWRWRHAAGVAGLLVVASATALPARHLVAPWVRAALVSAREECQLRVYAGHAVWRLLSQRPWLGWGPGSFGLVYGAARRGPVGEPFQAVERPVAAPGDVFLGLAEVGLPATMLLAALWVPALLVPRKGHAAPCAPREWRTALAAALGVSALGGCATSPIAAGCVLVVLGVTRGLRGVGHAPGPTAHCSWPRLALGAVIGLQMVASLVAERVAPARLVDVPPDPRSAEVLLVRASAVAARSPNEARSLLLEALRVLPLREEAARRAARCGRDRWVEVRLAHIAAADELAVLDASDGAPESTRAYVSLARQLRAGLARER